MITKKELEKRIRAQYRFELEKGIKWRKSYRIWNGVHWYRSGLSSQIECKKQIDQTVAFYVDYYWQNKKELQRMGINLTT